MKVWAKVERNDVVSSTSTVMPDKIRNDETINSDEEQTSLPPLDFALLNDLRIIPRLTQKKKKIESIFFETRKKSPFSSSIHRNETTSKAIPRGVRFKHAIGTR